VQEWIAAVGTKTAYIERGSPWENGYIESFNARLRDELSFIAPSFQEKCQTGRHAPKGSSVRKQKKGGARGEPHRDISGKEGLRPGMR
jgi:transposase InsO family protein